MPIKIPDDLPAKNILIEERVSVMDESTATRQDIRPLKILLFNLMPDKITTETQIARVLGAGPLQVELTLMRTSSYVGTNTAEDHLFTFYKTFDDLKTQRFDGIIVTGAPVEHLDFENVDYWNEMTTIMDWACHHCYSQFYICWAAQAAIYHFHGVKKNIIDKKHFGVFPHPRDNFTHPLMKGFDDIVNIPVSRYTEIDETSISANPALTQLLTSNDTGSALVTEDDRNIIFMFNHLEYDRETLQKEFLRDRERGIDTNTPNHYFPDNNPDIIPSMNWRAHRNLLFQNWINMVYQGTPYDLNQLN